MLFADSTRNKDRFSTPKGLLTSEDLWDLPLESDTKASLDKLAVSLDEELIKTTGKSFVKKATKSSADLQRKFDVVKYVIEVKMAEAKAKADGEAIADRKKLLVKALATKQAEELAGKSAEALLKEIKELEAK